MAYLVTERDGTLPLYTDQGCYPMYYLTADGAELCARCANGGNGAESHVGCASDRSAGNPRACQLGDAQWCVLACDVNWESDITCDHCGESIESAYGVVEQEQEQE